jgi:hypothetical protein
MVVYADGAVCGTMGHTGTLSQDIRASKGETDVGTGECITLNLSYIDGTGVLDLSILFKSMDVNGGEFANPL